MLARRLWRRPNINPASGECIVFAGKVQQTYLLSHKGQWYDQKVISNMTGSPPATYQTLNLNVVFEVHSSCDPGLSGIAHSDPNISTVCSRSAVQTLLPPKCLYNGLGSSSPLWILLQSRKYFLITFFAFWWHLFFVHEWFFQLRGPI